MMKFRQEIVEIVEGVLRPGGEPIALHEPEFSGVEEELVLDCIRSSFVSSVGKYVDQFEHELASICGVDHAVAVVNGTAALQVALRLSGVRPGSEVIMPSLTFVATANAAHYLGGLPHFVDISEDTLGVNPVALRNHLNRVTDKRTGRLINRDTGRPIDAIVPMHAFGHPSDLDGLLEVADEFNLPLIEDAAEALGSRWRGKSCGSFGSMGALSFNGNKIITTGGGGAILTDDAELAHQAKHLTTTAKVLHRWAFSHDEIGYNFRMPNLNAALGVAQLRQIESRIRSKRNLAKRYQNAFSDFGHGYCFEERPEAQSNYWLNALVLNPEVADARDEVLESLHEVGVMARPAWEPLHQLSIYRDCPRDDLPVTEGLARRIVNLPSSSFLGELYCG